MPAFDAGSVVEALDWNFAPYTDAKGTIKEPSDKQIAQFLQGIKTMIKDAEGTLPKDVAADDPAALLAALDDLDPEIVVSMMGKMAGVYSELCSRSPTRAQILALPMRVRSVFFAWLQSEVMNPEAAPGAGRA